MSSDPDSLRDIAGDLAGALTHFSEVLPGWWWTMDCSLFERRMSCGPDLLGPARALLRLPQFDAGFHLESEIMTMADVVLALTAKAQKAAAALRKDERAVVAAPGRTSSHVQNSTEAAP